MRRETEDDGGTRIVTRNADGTLASVTGTAVTPEYHTYGVTNLLGAAVRVHTIRYGRADSPRFTRTYTDGFGDVIREERSGANGATLVTENEYDAFGRLVASAETAQPLVEYAYDTWGDRIAQAQSTDDEWRLAETETASVVADDGEVWRETTASRSCSDAAIAPLVTVQRTRLSGLSLVTNAVTVTTDVRGNETVTIATLNPATQSSHEITHAPGILNVATNWYTDGVMVSNISHSGVQTQIRRDTLRRETARIDGRGNVTRTVYDALGRVAATIDALTNATTYAYDAMNRVAAITNALGDATVYEYDHRGNKIYEGGATYPVRYTYDVYGNKTTMTTYRHEPDGGAGRAALPATGDGVGRGVPTAPPGDTTTWLYDEASGVMTNKLYADGKGPCYTYTDDGKLATRTWARGIVTTYAYDGWGNLIETAYSDDTPTVTIAYDALGRQIEANDAAGVTTFAYDAFGANTNETVIGVAGTNTIERFIDAYGRDAGYTLNGVRQSILGYDEQTGRLATMQVNSTGNGRAGVPPPAADGGGTPSLPEDASPCLFRWTYLPGSDCKSLLAYPNGLTASWTYDANNQLLQVRNATPTNVISQYDYAYDAAGRRIAWVLSQSWGWNIEVGSALRADHNAESVSKQCHSVAARAGREPYHVEQSGRGVPVCHPQLCDNTIACARSGDAMSVADTIAYAYNARGELTNAVSDVDSNYAYSYQYDDIGNRVCSCERGTNTMYAANELNQYTSILGGPAESEPEFDDDGNQTLIRTATGTWRVTYNGENRPILWACVESNNHPITNQTILTMSYDRMGRRVTKNAERFVYDGYLQIANFLSPTPTQNSNCFTWDPTEPIATRPLVWNGSSDHNQPFDFQTVYYSHDGNKNVCAISGTNGVITACYDYAPFGMMASQYSAAADVNTWRFASEYYDFEIACDGYNYRHYDSFNGRFLSYDLIVGTTQYLLCGNNSVSGIDFLGLARMPPPINDFFRGERAERMIGGYVDVYFTSIGYKNRFSDMLSWIGCKVKLPEMFCRIEFVPRFNSPVHNQLKNRPREGADPSRGALGAIGDTFVPRSDAEDEEVQKLFGAPTDKWEKRYNPVYAVTSYYYGAKKFHYGYFVYYSATEEDEWHLVESNSDMFSSFDTSVNKVDRRDLSWSGKRNKCEAYAVEWGDKGMPPEIHVWEGDW